MIRTMTPAGGATITGTRAGSTASLGYDVKAPAGRPSGKSLSISPQEVPVPRLIPEGGLPFPPKPQEPKQEQQPESEMEDHFRRGGADGRPGDTPAGEGPEPSPAPEAEAGEAAEGGGLLKGVAALAELL